MALNLKSIGEKVGPFTKKYEPRDAMLYALGVGAGFRDLEYCYEKNLKVLPSFSIASIFDTLAGFAIKARVNIAGILHGEQELIFRNPIPSEGTLTTTGPITNIYDKGENKTLLVSSCDFSNRYNILYSFKRFRSVSILSANRSGYTHIPIFKARFNHS